MQITLNQDEIHIAVEQYVRGQINIADNQSINIDFTAGRGANGLSATLDIRSTAASAPAKKATRSVPVKEETKPEPEPEIEEEAEAPDEEPGAEPEEDAPKEEEKAPPKPKGPSIFAKG